MVAASGILMARLLHLGARPKHATEWNRPQEQRNATERNRLQVQRNATDGKDSLVMDACLHVQQRTEKTRNWNGHPKPEDDKGQRRTTTKVNDVQRHGNDEQQNGQRTMLFGRRMYACMEATSRLRRVGVKFLERRWAFSVGEGCARRRWTVGRST